MLAQDFIQYLTDEGYNVFPDPNFIPAADDMPESQLPALFVFGTGGFENHSYIDWQRPTFQVIVKGKSYKADFNNMTATEQLAKQLIKFLDKKINYQISIYHIYSSHAMHGNPTPLGLDENDRPMYSTNFRFIFREG